MNNLTIGDRISEYSSKFGINKILSSILIDPKANFVYSNGLEVEKNNVDACSQFVFFDCKEKKKISVVEDYLQNQKTQTLKTCAEKYGISVQTLMNWKSNYLKAQGK